MSRSISSASAELVCVDPALAYEAWKLAGPYIERAYETGIGDDTLEAVREMIFRAEALLWVIYESGTVSGAVVTRVTKSPSKKICTVLAIGGDGLPRWKHLLIKIEEYASSLNCDAVRIYGRRGWARIYPEYSQPWIALERKL